jgi:hypothetical protein
MVDVIDYELSKVSEEKRSTAYKNWGQEDTFFVSRMIEMNKKGLANYKLATRNATLTYGATGGAENLEVFAASGILPVIKFDVREKFLGYCPELKMLYPSLHDPNCFGAKPDAEKCAKSICALQVPRRKGGC